MTAPHNISAMVIPADYQKTDCPESGAGLWRANDDNVALIGHQKPLSYSLIPKLCCFRLFPNVNFW
jgi:hypothetical protein